MQKVILIGMNRMGISKGRRNYMESDINVLYASFKKRLVIKIFKYKHLQPPFDETFIGSNYKSYKHTYYLAKMINFTDFNGFQKSEVSKIEWKNFDSALKSIREYNVERKQILKNMQEIFTRYDIKIKIF